MDELIEILQTYGNEVLETEEERAGFVAYMAEAFKRYVAVKKRYDRAMERAVEKIRRVKDGTVN